MARKMAMVVLLVWNSSLIPQEGICAWGALVASFQVRVLCASYITPEPRP